MRKETKKEEHKVLLQFPVDVHGEGSASPWRVIRHNFFFFYNFSLEEGAGRAPKRRRVVFFCLCKWLWVIKIKEDERKEKKEGVLEGCLLFSFLLFYLFSHGCLLKCGDFSPNLVMFFVF